jgi:hypothetical protein
MLEKMMNSKKRSSFVRKPLADTGEAEPIMSFTRVIGLRAPTGAFDGWGPRISPATDDSAKPY